ncbi:MAG TPA: hypothetical protein VL092_11700 [Chitinophagaceae bacterium]|nr:hypothetical protein [Chitinophagaceae bacterium]
MPFSNNDQQALVRQLPDDLRFGEEPYLSEAEFLDRLAAKVSYMLQYNNGVFFQLLYKMDVLEPKLRIAMQTENVPMAIARLILERQLEKLEARKANPPTTAEDRDLEW